MKKLVDYIFESMPKYIIEGGQAGHMSHPFDYTDFTGNDLLELVDNLFAGKIEHMKEKLDGMNIMASVNKNGDTIFSRNKSERNSETGGVLTKDLDARWEGKEHQKKVFKTCCTVIDTIFQKVLKSEGIEYFNPDANTRKFINCECLVEGKTNNVPYDADRVAFHGYYMYKGGPGNWKEDEKIEGDVDVLYKAAEGIDIAKPRPDLIIKSATDAAKFADKFKIELNKLFKSENLTMNDSIEDWKKERFKKIKPEWVVVDDNFNRLFDRWFNDNKIAFSAKDLKLAYGEHYDEVKDNKFAKQYISKVMEPIDNLFLLIGNELMSILDGFTNSTTGKAVQTLKKEVEEITELIKQKGSTEAQEKVELNLQRLQALGNKYNATEGIVLTYKGRLMKLTGSFAPINQILGTCFTLEK